MPKLLLLPDKQSGRLHARGKEVLVITRTWLFVWAWPSSLLVCLAFSVELALVLVPHLHCYGTNYQILIAGM